MFVGTRRLDVVLRNGNAGTGAVDLLVRTPMTDVPRPTRWHAMNEGAAQALTTVTNSPGVVYPMGITELPDKLKPISGVASYYVSGYVSPQALTDGLTVGGEMLVARVESGTTKNYQFVFATSSDGNVYFAGPYKGFGHHVESGQSIPVNSLFGNTPFSTGQGS
jgi:hypothetical protein